MANQYEIDIRGQDASKAAFKKVKQSVNDVENALQQTVNRGKQAASVFKGMTMSRVVVDMLYKVRDAVSEVVRMGFQYNATMESSKLGIASILASQMTLVGAEGKILKGREALNASLQLSGDLVKQIEIRGLQTTATMEQLVTAFQEAVGPATSMGLSLQQAQAITLDIVQAAGALGIPMNQINEEVRSIVGGTINMNSRVAKAVGLTNAMVKNWAKQGVLAEKLTEKFAIYRAAGDETAKTWQGLVSNTEEAVAKISGALTADVFEDVKNGLADALKSVIQVSDESANIAPGILEAKAVVNDLWDALKNVWAIFRDTIPLESIAGLLKQAAALTKKITEGWRLISESWAGKAIKTGLSGIIGGWKHILGLVAGGTAYLDQMAAAQRTVADATRDAEAATKRQIAAYGQLSADKIKAYRDAYTKAIDYLEKEKEQFRRIEEAKAEIAKRTASIRESLVEKELSLKRRLADFDKNEKALKRELDILKGKRKPLTEEEKKKERIADLEERLKRLQEDRKKAQDDYNKEVKKSQDEIAKLEKKGGTLAKKYAEMKGNIQLVEKALSASSEGTLKFNEGLSKAVRTANQLAKNLITAGRAISAYNANLPESIKTKQAFDWKTLEADLQAPMQKTAQATNQAKEKIEEINRKIPAAVRELKEKEKAWQRINDLEDKHLQKLERIRYAYQNWGFRMEGVTESLEGQYAPGY